MACCGLKTGPALYIDVCLEVCPQAALTRMIKLGSALLVPADPCLGFSAVSNQWGS